MLHYLGKSERQLDIPLPLSSKLWNTILDIKPCCATKPLETLKQIDVVSCN